MDDLYRLAELLKAKNAIDNLIAALTNRPALIGHTGEYIASIIFGIKLQKSAAHKASDGHFVGGSLNDRAVNIKWYTKHDRIIALSTGEQPDDYLVLTGPKTAPVSSVGTTRPWVIESVFLFDAKELVSTLLAQGTKLSVATGVPKALWTAAEIYPVQHNQRLVLSDEQRTQLALFRPENSA
ncbi:MAG TPA: hypothetical protein VLA19_00115 [Herpetosiphonaceae bacterium]|nr:hypothetical protein [Herpetosiphonaceae bacterium]